MSRLPLPSAVPAGDEAILFTFAEEISPKVNARVQALARVIESRRPPGVRESVIAYATLLVFYDSLAATYQEVRDAVLALSEQASGTESVDQRLVEIPTVFGGPYGQDLLDVAARKGMAPEEVLRKFCGATYTVYMLGFAPGNPYLGGLPPELALPRLESPRERVPAGTVALANQAVIYALTTPGGWHWMGRTAVKMFDPHGNPPTYLQAGDRVKFVPITEEEYLAMGGEKAE